MSCAEVLIGHVHDVDGGDDEEDGDGDYHLVSQRATCCFAESGSAFVNWELKVPENDYDADADADAVADAGWVMLGGGKDAIMGDKGEKRGFLRLLCFIWQYCTWRPHCVTSWMLRSCNPSTHSLLVLVHPLFLCFVNPPELECTQYWVTSHHPSSVKA